MRRGSRLNTTAPTTSAAATPVSVEISPSPASHASTSATTGFTKAYVLTAAAEVTRSSQV